MGTRPTEKHDPFGWAGATLEGKYRIDGVLGEGGFGVVYAAHHLGFDEPVAIKFLRLETLPLHKRDAFSKSFKAEGKILFRLSSASPSIVRAIDVGEAISPNGAWTPFLVLELLRGETLAEELARRSGGRAFAEALALLTPAARALDVAHGEGVAHRDVKPGNLILTEVQGQPSVKVLDFGVAKLMGDARSVAAAKTTEMGVRAFSSAYGAPEQWDRNLGATGPWTDVFALALVLVEVVTGRSALGSDNTAVQRANALDLNQRPTLRHFGVQTTDAVESVLQRGLAVDPRNRFQRAGELWDALEQAVANKSDLCLRPPKKAATTEEHHSPQRGSRARDTEVSRHAPGTVLLPVAHTPRPTPSDPGRKPAQGRSVRALVVTASVLSALGISFCAFVLRGSGESTAAVTADTGASPPGSGATARPSDPAIPGTQTPTVYARAWDASSRCYDHIGAENAIARKECQEALDLNPSDRELRRMILYNMCLVECHDGNFEAARAYCMRSLQSGENRTVRGALKMLSSGRCPSR